MKYARNSQKSVKFGNVINFLQSAILALISAHTYVAITDKLAILNNERHPASMQLVLN